MSQEKIYQVRKDDTLPWFEVTQHEQEGFVNGCGWKGRVLVEVARAPTPWEETVVEADLHQIVAAQAAEIAQWRMGGAQPVDGAAGVKPVAWMRTVREYYEWDGSDKVDEVGYLVTEIVAGETTPGKIGWKKEDPDWLPLYTAAPAPVAPVDLSDEQIDIIVNKTELEVRRGFEAWDMLPPRELVRALLAAARKEK